MARLVILALLSVGLAQPQGDAEEPDRAHKIGVEIMHREKWASLYVNNDVLNAKLAMDGRGVSSVFPENHNRSCKSLLYEVSYQSPKDIRKELKAIAEEWEFFDHRKALAKEFAKALLLRTRTVVEPFAKYKGEQLP